MFSEDKKYVIITDYTKENLLRVEKNKQVHIQKIQMLSAVFQVIISK